MAGVAAADAVHPRRPFAHHEGAEQGARQEGVAHHAAERIAVLGEVEVGDALPARYVAARLAQDRGARGLPEYAGAFAGCAH